MIQAIVLTFLAGLMGTNGIPHFVQGISARLMKALLDRETGPLYTMVNEKRAPYYEPFGFRRVDVSQLPADFRKEYRIGRIITTLRSLFSRDRVHIIPMRRKSP